MLAVVSTGVLYARSFIADGQASSLMKRNERSEVLSMIWIVVNIIILFPILVAAFYTVGTIFPVLAIVEDEDTAAYNPIALDDEDVVPVASGQKKSGAMPLHGVVRGQTDPVTSSLLGTWRTFTCNGGWRDTFRGLALNTVYNFVLGVFVNAFLAIFSSISISIAILVGSLVMAPMATAWVHIVMTERSGRSWYHRLPPFKTTLKATAGPIVLYWLSIVASNVAPLVLMRVLGMPLPGFTSHGDKTMLDPTDPAYAWKGPVVILASIFFGLLEVPALIILVRVQASLLPEDENTVVPFDRTFGGVVSPTFEGGNGFATIKEAWSSFTRASWLRLIVLQFKIVFLNIGVMAFVMMFIGVQVGIVSLILNRH